MSSNHKNGNREAKKPKKEQPKTIAAALSTKGQAVTAAKLGMKH